jgi:predicted RNA-binding protein with PUA-like domain
MAAWILKTEPETYSWDDLVREGRTAWTGVRNFAAAKNLRAMKTGDEALIYHSGAQKAVVGLAKVVRAAYPDPTAKEGDWVAVDIAPVKPARHPVTLAEMKKDKALAGMVMVRQGRLSVSPVTAEERKRLIE